MKNETRLNDLMKTYTDSETGKEVTELTLKFSEKDLRNYDLKEWLLDFGLAGKLEKQLKSVLAYNTTGYTMWKRKNTNGRWTEDCIAFDGTKEVVKYHVTDSVNGQENEILTTEDRIEAIKKAGSYYNDLSITDRKIHTIEIKVYDDEIEKNRVDIIPWHR